MAWSRRRRPRGGCTIAPPTEPWFCDSNPTSTWQSASVPACVDRRLRTRLWYHPGRPDCPFSSQTYEADTFPRPPTGRVRGGIIQGP
jgi:hypothetical protein